MNTSGIAESMTTLFAELVDGPPKEMAFMLNGGDPGLLGSLDRLSAQDASRNVDGGATVAGHVDHLRYYLSLMNRWAGGEGNPFVGADWTVAWRTTTVSEEEWRRLRDELRDEAHRWLRTLGEPRDVAPIELNGMLGSIAHLGYHLGAIRQISRAARGPRAEE